MKAFVFGRFRLVAEECLLLLDGQAVALEPQVFKTLLTLVENSGHLCEKGWMIERIWGDTIVEQGNLTRNISVLRRVLGDEYIQTVPKIGYRFVGGARELSDDEELVRAERTRETIVVEEEDTSDKFANSAESGGLIRRVVSRKYGVVIALCSILVGITALGFYIAALQRPQQVAHLRIKSIAVLPFKPLVANSGDESLEMGVAEALITKLSRISEIIVRPIGSVSKYTHPEQDAMAAGLEQRVDAVVDGTIQKDGDRIRVTARFVRVQDGSVLWADEFDQKFTNILSVQDAISERTVGALA